MLSDAAKKAKTATADVIREYRAVSTRLSAKGFIMEADLIEEHRQLISSGELNGKGIADLADASTFPTSRSAHSSPASTVTGSSPPSAAAMVVGGGLKQHMQEVAEACLRAESLQQQICVYGTLEDLLPSLNGLLLAPSLRSVALQVECAVGMFHSVLLGESQLVDLDGVMQQLEAALCLTTRAQEMEGSGTILTVIGELEPVLGQTPDVFEASERMSSFMQELHAQLKSAQRVASLAAEQLGVAEVVAPRSAEADGTHPVVLQLEYLRAALSVVSASHKDVADAVKSVAHVADMADGVAAWWAQVVVSSARGIASILAAKDSLNRVIELHALWDSLIGVAKSAQKSLKDSGAEPTDAPKLGDDVGAMFEALDANHDGKIAMHEWLAFFSTSGEMASGLLSDLQRVGACRITPASVTSAMDEVNALQESVTKGALSLWEGTEMVRQLQHIAVVLQASQTSVSIGRTGVSWADSCDQVAQILSGESRHRAVVEVLEQLRANRMQQKGEVSELLGVLTEVARELRGRWNTRAAESVESLVAEVVDSVPEEATGAVRLAVAHGSRQMVAEAVEVVGFG